MTGIVWPATLDTLREVSSYLKNEGQPPDAWEKTAREIDLLIDKLDGVRDMAAGVCTTTTDAAAQALARAVIEALTGTSKR
jgi:hypothetical protein